MPSLTDGLSKTADPILSAALSEMDAESTPSDQTEPTDADDSQPEPTSDAGTNPADAAEPEAGDDGASDGAAPDESAQTDPTAGVDPLADLQPLTATANGETFTIEGVHVTPDGGIVDLDAIPKLQQEFSRARALESVNRDLYQRVADIDRVTEWRVKAPDGTEQTLKGTAGIEAMRVAHAEAVGALMTLSKVFGTDPSEYLTVDPQTGKVMWDQRALNYLKTESALTERSYADQVRAHFTSSRSQAVEQQQAAELPNVIWSQVDQHWLKEFPTLTAEDKTFLQQQMARYLRDASPEERANGSTPKVVDYAFRGVIEDRAKLRTQAAKTAEAAERAGKFNRGQQQARQKPAASKSAPATPAPAAAAPKGKQAQWDDLLHSALSELNLAQ